MTDTVIIDPRLVEIESQQIVDPGTPTTRTFDTVVVEVGRTVVVEDDVPVVEVDVAQQECVIQSREVEVVQIEAGIPGPGGSGGGTGVFVTGVTAIDGLVGDEERDASGAHLYSAKTDAISVVVTVLVEGGPTIYRPEVMIGGIDAVVTETSTKRIFSATATVDLDVGVNLILVTSSAGGADMVEIERLNPGPAVLSASIVAPTAPQTNYRAGQVAQVDVYVEDTAVSVTVAAGGACASQVTAPVVSGHALVSFTVSSVASDAPVSVFATNDFGTAGVPVSSDNVPIDQVTPAISLAVAYPAGQYAVENGESIMLTTAASNVEAINYSFLPGLVELSTVDDVKTVGCTSSSNDTILTISATASKASNQSSATATASVRVCNVAPSLSVAIDGNPAFLTRSPLGTLYTLRVTASQPLIDLTVSGIAMSPQSGRTVWTGTFRVYDSTPAGALLVEALAHGAAGHEGTASRTFTVGGFTSRTITWPAFSRVAPLGLAVYDQTKVAVNLGSKILTRQEDAVDRPNGFYVADAAGSYDPHGSYIALSDVAFAGSNTSGTLQGTVVEN